MPPIIKEKTTFLVTLVTLNALALTSFNFLVTSAKYHGLKHTRNIHPRQFVTTWVNHCSVKNFIIIKGIGILKSILEGPWSLEPSSF